MRRLEDECVGCPEGMGCLGNSCPYKNVPHFYCDRCEEETKLYHFEDEELCEHCLLEEFLVVEGTDEW